MRSREQNRSFYLRRDFSYMPPEMKPRRGWKPETEPATHVIRVLNNEIRSAAVALASENAHTSATDCSPAVRAGGEARP